MENFQRNVKHYIKIHKELHGSTFKWEEVVRAHKISFPDNDAMEVLAEVERQEQQDEKDSKRYGVFIGRCQPFTNGHDATIQEIIIDGRIPIMIVGGEDKNDDRHPLDFEDVKTCIKKKYPFGIKIFSLKDNTDWTGWYNSVKQVFIDNGINKEQIVLYSHAKEMDNKDFEYNGKQYANASYTEMFKDNNVQIKVMNEVTCSLGETIHASDVRKNESIAIRNLDARIYRFLKDKKGWWSEN